MKTTKICATCDQSKVKDILETAFKDDGFRISYKGATGVAEKGNKTMHMLFGAFAKYHKIEFNVMKRSNDTIVNVNRASSGLAGGLIGKSQTDNAYKGIVDKIINKFNENNVQIKIEQ